MDTLNNFKLYDKLVGATYTNLAIEAINNGKLYFKEFNNNSYIDKVFLKISLIVANFENKYIYLNCKFFDFLKILFNNYNIKEIITHKYRLRFTRRKQEKETNITEIARFEAKEFFTDIGIFEEIWKEYYQK